jgi:hypothetical protein
MVLVFSEPGDTHLRRKFTPEAESFWAWLFRAPWKLSVSRSKSSSRSQINSKKQLQALLERLPAHPQTEPADRAGQLARLLLF